MMRARRRWETRARAAVQRTGPLTAYKAGGDHHDVLKTASALAARAGSNRDFSHGVFDLGH